MRIAIVSPARDMCHTAYAHDLAGMIGYTATARPDIILGNYIMLGTMIFDQRIKLAREAVQDGSDYVLWFDTDMRFPKDTLLRLLAREGLRGSELRHPADPVRADLVHAHRERHQVGEVADWQGQHGAREGSRHGARRCDVLDQADQGRR
jgi:hypothetical protein